MKEMCRNFVCNNRCQQKTTDRKQCAVPYTAETTSIMPDTSMGDCNTCVIERVGLAQAFVPTQPFTQPMDQEQSLICGTAFSDLAMPYCSGWNIYRFGREA